MMIEHENKKILILPGIDPIYTKDPTNDACVSVKSYESGDSSGFRNFGIIGPDQLRVYPKIVCPMYTKKFKQFLIYKYVIYNIFV